MSEAVALGIGVLLGAGAASHALLPILRQLAAHRAIEAAPTPVEAAMHASVAGTRPRPVRRPERPESDRPADAVIVGM